LWVLCLALAYAKIITAGILLLPLALLPFDKIPKKKVLIPAALALVCLVGYAAVLKVIDGMRESNALGLDYCNAQLAALETLDGWKLYAKAYGVVLLRLMDIRQISSPLGWLDTHLNPYHNRLIIISGAAALIFDGFRYAPALQAALRGRRREVFLCLGLIVGVLFFITFSDSLIYFIIGAYPGNYWDIRIQMRHLFPGIITALLLPLMLVNKRPAAAVAIPNASIGQIANYTALLVSFFLLLFVRDIELAIDLLVRYW
jgi:hypothetical protein